MSRAGAIVAVAGFTAAFWWQGERFVAANGPTFDEATHLSAGYSYWATGEFRLNPEDPPLAKLAWALPLYLFDPIPFTPVLGSSGQPDEWLTGQRLLYAEPGRAERLLTPARRVNLLFGAAVVPLVGWWAYRVWGSRLSAVLAAGLAALDPTRVAISGVLSTDAALTLFFTLTAYLLWEYAGRPTRWRLAAVGVSLGLTLGSKFSALFAVAALGLGVAGFLLAGGSFGPGGTLAERVRAAVTPAVRATIIALLTLVPLYFVVHFPDWGVGLKQQLVRNDFGTQHYYFLGKVIDRPSVGYFFVALALKLPLGTVGLFVLSVLAWGSRRFSEASLTGPRWWLVILPPVGFLLAMTATGVDIGVRVVLPVVPFLYLFAAGIAARGPYRPLRLVVAAVGLIGAAVAVGRAGPHQLAYFTEPVGGPEQGIRYLGDSNLDWGQDLPALKAYLDREGIDVIYLSYAGTCPPGYYGIRYQALPGWGALEPPPPDRVPADAPRHVVAVSATNLQGIYLKNADTYAWLRNRHPVAIPGGSIWVFDLTGDAEAIARVRDTR